MTGSTKTQLPQAQVLKPRIFEDSRGFFFESFNQNAFLKQTGTVHSFVQDNHSFSKQNILRGLHYQIRQPQGKLVRVVNGSIFDVAVDLHRSSDRYGQWVGEVLSAENKQQLWIPPGFAHGFYVLSETADVLYKATDYYSPGDERTILWNDPDLAIDWPLQGAQPTLSEKDQAGVSFQQAEVFE